MQPQQPQQPQELTFESSLQLIVDGVQVAQKRGAFSLQESSSLYQAILKIQEELQKQNPPKPEEKVEQI